MTPSACPSSSVSRFTLFNVEQCEGVPDEAYGGTSPLPEAEIIPYAERLIEATGADFRVGGTEAFYVRSENFIRVPSQPTFFEQINYYRACFHELDHYADSRIMQRRLLTLLVSKTFRHSISA